MNPGDASLLLLGDASFVLPAEVLLQYEHLYTRSNDGRATPFFQMRDGRYWIRLAEVDRWVSLDPYRDAYSSLRSAKALSPTDPVGVDFVEADEAHGVAPRDPFAVDPDVIDRGTRGHARTLNALARHLRDHGLEPRLPGAGDPLFDLAWICDNRVWVAEVKSTTDSNEERQMRLGLGQILRYRQVMLRRANRPVRASLVVENGPQDRSWVELCASLNVTMCWPVEFNGLIND